MLAAEFGHEIRDGDWRLLRYNPRTGATTWMVVDGDKTHFRTDTPVEHLIKDNVERRNDSAGDRWGDGKVIANIPQSILFDQKLGLSEAISQEDDKYVNKWLNDSDNRAFRTFEGHV